MAVNQSDTSTVTATSVNAAPVEPAIELSASAWQSDATQGAAPAQINVSEQLDQILSNPEQEAKLLADAGFAASSEGGQPSARISNLQASLAEGEAGSWDGSIYTPTWDAAFSDTPDRPVYFNLTYDIEDQDFFQATGETLILPWTALLALQLDRSGLDYSGVIASQSPGEPAVTIQSANGAGILIAFGRELQAQRGLSDQPISVALTDGDVAVPFSNDQLKAVMEVIGNYNFISNIPNNNPVFAEDPDYFGSFSNGQYSFYYRENTAAGIEIGQVKATDADNDVLTYSIVTNLAVDDGNGGTTDAYQINASTGVISLTSAGAAALTNDFERLANAHSITVAVTDGSAPPTSVTVNLNELDTDETPQKLNFFPAQTIRVDNSDPEVGVVQANTTLGRFEVIGLDSGLQQGLTLADDSGKFKIVDQKLVLKESSSQKEIEQAVIGAYVIDDSGNKLSLSFQIPKSRFTTADIKRYEEVFIFRDEVDAATQYAQLSVTKSENITSFTAEVVKDIDGKPLPTTGNLISRIIPSGNLATVDLFTPFIDFTAKSNRQGVESDVSEIFRFEFELPRLSYSQLNQVSYIKLYSSENFEEFKFEDSTGTGFQLEQLVGDDFQVVTAANFSPDLPVYLAVYIKDNGRGDTDSELGVVRDPGIILLINQSSTGGPSGGPSSSPGSTGSGAGGGEIDPNGTTRQEPAVITLPAGQKDFVYSGSQPLIVQANDQDNFVVTGSGDDQVRSGRGNDVVRSGSGNDFVSANQGNDAVNGNAGLDSIRGGRGQDSLRGGRGSDFIGGDRGSDLIRGDRGHDRLEGGRGSDTVYGGAGYDHLQGVDSTNGRGAGERDVLEGGALSDVFYLGDESGAYYIDLVDGMVGFAHITDFDSEDKIGLMNRDGLRVVRNTNVNGIDGSGVAIFMQDDLIAFIQGDAAAINSIDLDDETRVVRQRFADLVPAR